MSVRPLPGIEWEVRREASSQEQEERFRGVMIKQIPQVDPKAEPDPKYDPHERPTQQNECRVSLHQQLQLQS